MTGFNLFTAELGAKRLEILKEILPAARRFAMLIDDTTSQPWQLQANEAGARALGVTLQTVSVSSPAEFTAAFAALQAGGAEAVDILGSMLFNFRDELGKLALADKLPAICEWPEMAAAGCLASYGFSLREPYGTLAELTDKILKGASPADLPARQPTKFELVINRKTAQTIGIEIPQSILARADEVIE
jgi:putative ABC transport system substrate-binding protein